ncbi:type VI secretion system tube protein Hcp [Reinekea sp.]|jgi:type VI secretion system Hcp family effector|uniref:type VI secretion system tube protein Hcp n=1 Tax=Reinekea sp. TaxID=1970455 RepID=UPI002A7F25DA|nr:type VI secretion system tube protein Hcp [Reinekea sp.]
MAGILNISSNDTPIIKDNVVFDMRHGVGLGGVQTDARGWSTVNDTFSASNQTLRHQAVQLVRAVDAYTPRLMSALTNYELFDELEVAWKRVNETGEIEFDYRIVLAKAQLIYSAPWDFGAVDGDLKEMLTFSYRDITWKYLAYDPKNGDLVKEKEASSDGFF